MYYFFFSFFLSFVLTLLIKWLALGYDIVDKPDGQRKIHGRIVPLLGGVAIFLAFWLTIFFLFLTGGLSSIFSEHLLGVFFGGLVLIILGYFDDRYNLPVKIRLGVSVLAVLLVLIGGVGIDGITNPLGGILSLDMWKLSLLGGEFVVLADILVFFWLMGMMYTTKILDGLDGLATGIIMIGGVMIFLLSTFTIFKQADVSLVSLVLVGACLGFLLWNFYPAKIFLGEGGGLFLGFILGVLAIISGGKIATALLVMAFPVFDLVRVIYLRIKNKQSMTLGDRRHLHFQLVDVGFSQRQVVLFLYAVAFIFGMTTLFFPSHLKIITLIVLGLAMVTVGVLLDKKQIKH
jgi:UDP-GlcNAc:undecaprenyl-phosphate GlcNAc-1-phosphate transferase